MRKNLYINVAVRVLFAGAALSLGLWAAYASIAAASASIKSLGSLGAEGFAPEDPDLLFSHGLGFAFVFFSALAFTVLVPISVLALPTIYYNRCKSTLVRIAVFLLVLSLDCSIVFKWFSAYNIKPDIDPIPHAFDEIRAGLGPVERLVYGELLDQAERGASSWVVVVHAAVLTALILIAFEILRWVFRRFRASKATKVSRDAGTASQ